MQKHLFAVIGGIAGVILGATLLLHFGVYHPIFAPVVGGLAGLGVAIGCQIDEKIEKRRGNN